MIHLSKAPKWIPDGRKDYADVGRADGSGWVLRASGLLDVISKGMGMYY